LHGEKAAPIEFELVVHGPRTQKSVMAQVVHVGSMSVMGVDHFNQDVAFVSIYFSVAGERGHGGANLRDL
jgi:hypothetical protein